ncbi:MAG: cell division ATP-binding protein FtsE [Bacteroidia bacterium]|nr:cell division ATP-binding protein FtsE [Bacteroidia bacterium]
MNLVPEDIIIFESVSAGYTKQPVLQNITFRIKKGEFVYLIGKTGAGKSTLLKLLYAELKPLTGTLQIGNFITNRLSSHQIPFLRRKLGIVFQDFQLLPDRTVAENVAFAMEVIGVTDKNKIRNRVSDVLMMTGLSTKLHSYPHQLSGGEQQRTVIARAIVNEPLILIADEPTGNLDPEVTTAIMELLMKINRSGTAVLMATHEHDLIRRYPARVLECREGTIFSGEIPQENAHFGYYL